MGVELTQKGDKETSREQNREGENRYKHEHALMRPSATGLAQGQGGVLVPRGARFLLTKAKEKPPLWSGRDSPLFRTPVTSPGLGACLCCAHGRD